MQFDFLFLRHGCNTEDTKVPNTIPTEVSGGRHGSILSKKILQVLMDFHASK